MTRRLFSLTLATALLLTACTDGPSAAPPSAPTPGSSTVQVVPTATAAPEPTPTTTITPSGVINGLPNLDEARSIATRPAPLGTYVVARRDAGIGGRDGVTREIPVYDEPFGSPRTLLDTNVIEATSLPTSLVNLSDPFGVLVMRVIAGGPEGRWLLVQAPTRPHDSYIWVRRGDFDFGYTAKRIEIDLAGPGQLQVFDGDRVILQSGIVQGRDSRETPTHMTYLQHGVSSKGISPAYGELILSIASFSEVLSSFGGSGGLPSNFIHGTNQPELMGQRVSSGEIRLPNETILELAELVLPGTPVLLFDSSGARPSRAEILDRRMWPAATADFLAGAPTVVDATTGVTPQIWRRCEFGGTPSVLDPQPTPSSIDELESDLGVPVQPINDDLLCRNEGSGDFVATGSELEHVFAVAKPDAGEVYETVTGRPMIPVFDRPGGLPRALVYINDVDRRLIDYPLYAETVFGEPTVLSVLKTTLDGDWLLVRAPVLPHNTSVWVRSQDFDLGTTTLRVEVDIGYEFLGRLGMMSVWDGHQSLMAAKISSGRDSRPTVPVSTYVDQIFDGTSLAAAYGLHLFSTPTYSEELSVFGGGGLPRQAIHGINAEPAAAIMGTPASSGSIHVAPDTVDMMAEFGLLGARVIIYDSRSPSTTEQAIRDRPVARATTKPIDQVDPTAPIPSFT